MQDHDIPIKDNLSTDGFGLEHGETLHSEDCECLQCTMYWSITDAVIDVMLDPVADCEGDDCQGCPKCPDTPMSEIFQPVVFHDPYISHDEAMALAFERDFHLFASFTRPLDLDPTTKLPAMLERNDGETLFYDGVLNSLFGEPAGCKSWIAVITAIEKVRHGGRVVWWDFEDNATTLSTRFNALGAKDVIDSGRVKWAGAAMTESPVAMLQAADWAKGGDVAGMVIIDACESAGCPVDSNNVRPWYATMVDPWLFGGVGVLLIDHVPKQRIDRPMGPIGSQYKRQAVQGASLFASGQPWTKQADGRIVLRLHKDRHGDVPGVLNKPVAAVNCKHVDGLLTYSITAPDNDDVDQGELSEQLLQGIMEAGDDGVVGGRAIRALVKGKGQDIDNALSELIANDLVERVKVGQAYRYSVTIEGMSAD